MPWASAPALAVSARQEHVLERLIRGSTTPQALATRARIIQLASRGTSTRQVAQQLGVTRNTVQLWRERWTAATQTLLAAEAEGGGGDDRAVEVVIRGVLADEPRPGAPPTFTPEQLCQIMALACEPPGDSGRPISQWTPRELADEARKRTLVVRISARTVGRFLASGGGRAPTTSEPVLAHPPRARSRGTRDTD